MQESTSLARPIRIGPVQLWRDAAAIRVRSAQTRVRSALLLGGLLGGGVWLGGLLLLRLSVAADWPAALRLSLPLLLLPALLGPLGYRNGRRAEAAGLDIDLTRGELRRLGPSGSSSVPISGVRGFAARAESNVDSVVPEPLARSSRVYAAVALTDAAELPFLPSLTRPHAEALARCLDAWVLGRGSFEERELADLRRTELYAVLGLLGFLAALGLLFKFLMP